jgi:signal transduction histidine kinase
MNVIADIHFFTNIYYFILIFALILTHYSTLMPKKKKYLPCSRLNPAALAARIDKLQADVENHKIILDVVTKSHEQHMEHLSNFAKHDIGNAVQSMFAVLKLSEKRMAATDILELKAAINNVNASLENFEQLVPYTKDGSFDLRKLMTGIEILCRSTMSLEKIHCTYNFDRSNKQLINQPFQAILQLLNNLMINAVKALKHNNEKKIIEVSSVVDEQNCIIFVKDTGCGIPDENLDRIFDYKFTTTPGGSGIGLFHARHVCKSIDGEIRFERNNDGFSTIFIFKFPIDGTKKNTCN